MTSSTTKETIVLFKGPSQYGVLRNMMDKLGEAFITLGYPVIIFEYRRNPKELVEIVNSRSVFFIFEFNGLGMVRTIDQTPLYDHIHAPYISYLVDSPIHHYKTLTADLKNKHHFIAGFVDQAHMRFVNNYFKSEYQTSFLPQFSHYRPIKEVKPIKRREHEIVFTGTGIDPETIRNKWTTYGKKVYELMENIVEEAMYQHEKDLTEIAAEVLYLKGIEKVNLTTQHFSSILAELDKYIRQQRRKEIIIKLSELPLCIYGNGWDYLGAVNKKVKIVSGGNWDETFQIMHNAKIVLNIMPNWTNGPHERMLNTMICGAVSLSDQNVYLKQHFRHKENLLFYNFNDEHLIKNIQEYLKDKEMLQYVADNGRSKVLKEYTAINFAKKLIAEVRPRK